MNDDMTDTIVPKSDQLNADDLITGPITVTITGVSRGTPDQPINVEIDGGHHPYRPAKSMRRVMIAAWGPKGRDWIGKRLTLFCDPTVKFGGVQLGGIRISHMSDIDGKLSLMLTTTRSKRAPFTVEPLPDVATYPADLFAKNFPAWVEMMTDGTMTASQIILKAGERAPLTDGQKEKIAAAEDEIAAQEEHK